METIRIRMACENSSNTTKSCTAHQDTLIQDRALAGVDNDLQLEQMDLRGHQHQRDANRDGSDRLSKGAHTSVASESTYSSSGYAAVPTIMTGTGRSLHTHTITRRETQDTKRQEAQAAMG